MNIGSYDTTMFLAILPEILLLVLGVMIIIFDVLLPKERDRNLGWISAGGLTLILLLTLAVGRPGARKSLTEPERPRPFLVKTS